MPDDPASESGRPALAPRDRTMAVGAKRTGAPQQSLDAVLDKVASRTGGSVTLAEATAAVRADRDSR